MKIWYVDFDETRMKLEAFQPVPYRYKDEKTMEKLIVQFTNDLFKEMVNDPISDCIDTLQTLKYGFSQKLISTFISYHSTLKSVPVDWDIFGCEKIETARVFGEPRKFLVTFNIDVIFNNWYIQTFMFPIVNDTMLRQFIRCIQLKYGFHNLSISYDDILSALATAAIVNGGDNMNMRWLKKYVTETNDIDEVEVLFHGLNNDGMAPEFTELKMMCMKRMSERIDKDGVLRI